MPQWIEADASKPRCRVIAKKTCDKAVRRLMKGDGDDHRDRPDRHQENHLRQVAHSTLSSPCLDCIAAMGCRRREPPGAVNQVGRRVEPITRLASLRLRLGLLARRAAFN